MAGDIMEMILGLMLNVLYFLLGITVGLAIVIILFTLSEGLKKK